MQVATGKAKDGSLPVTRELGTNSLASASLLEVCGLLFCLSDGRVQAKIGTPPLVDLSFRWFPSSWSSAGTLNKTDPSVDQSFLGRQHQGCDMLGCVVLFRISVQICSANHMPCPLCLEAVGVCVPWVCIFCTIPKSLRRVSQLLKARMHITPRCQVRKEELQVQLCECI